MATWVTHLMIADKVMEHFPKLDRRGFCVGNIAPDCNVENEDWTVYTPSRVVTHWMSQDRKVVSDSDKFYDEYIINRRNEIKNNEQYSFLLGYYVHLITDGSFQWFIRDEERVKATWDRVKADATLSKLAVGYSEDWDSIKKIIPKDERMHVIEVMEAEYLRDNPNCGYLTEIMTLKEFPDYIDYLPHGSIVRKIGVMGYMPELDANMKNPIAITREEFSSFVNNTVDLVVSKFEELKVI